MLKTVPNLNIKIPGHTILDKIGDGGMSTVYLARQESLQRKVAVKVIRTNNIGDANVLARFVNEAKTIARLDHPNIISIFEVNQLDNGIAYYTMPYLPHGDLSRLTSFGSQQLINLFVQICNGLSFAHAHGVVHRDLKPENLLFDDFGNIIIADFGIALHINNKRRTLDSEVLGSSHYMSPEQVRRQNVDLRSDIYAVGSILYEKLTGESLFEEGDDLSVLISQVNQPVPILPEGLNSWQNVVDTCLAKKPADRFQSADELASALLELGQNRESIIIHNDKIKWYQSKWFSSAVIAILLVVMGFSLFNLYQLNKSNEELSAELSTVAASATEQMIRENKPPAIVPEAAEEKIPVYNPTLMQLPAATDETFTAQQVMSLLIDANKDIQQMRLTRPANDNATEKLQRILALQPDNADAINGLNKINTLYIQLIGEAWKDRDMQKTISLTETLRAFIKNNSSVSSLKLDQQLSEISAFISQHVKEDVAAHVIRTETNKWMQFAQQLGLNDNLLADLQSQLNSIPKLGQIFRDAAGFDTIYITPDLVANSGVSFFNITPLEVTLADYQTFAQTENAPEHNCHHLGKQKIFKKSWKKPFFDQSPSDPVVCITADDAQNFAKWLSQKSGHHYRLPTRQEWVYLQNAASTSSNSCRQANQAGLETEGVRKISAQRHACTDAHVYTASAGSLAANSLSIHDLSGNVSEWVLNCETASNCNQYTAIGTSWLSGTEQDSTAPLAIASNEAHSHIGFRLVRDIYAED